MTLNFQSCSLSSCLTAVTAHCFVLTAKFPIKMFLINTYGSQTMQQNQRYHSYLCSHLPVRDSGVSCFKQLMWVSSSSAADNTFRLFFTVRLVVLSLNQRWLRWHHLRQIIRLHHSPSRQVASFRSLLCSTKQLAQADKTRLLFEWTGRE